MSTSMFMTSSDVVRLVRQMLDSGSVPPRVGWWLALVVDEALVSREALQALETGQVKAYLVGDEIWLEMTLPHRWRDRRILGPRAVRYLQINGGVRFYARDRAQVVKCLTEIFPDSPENKLLSLVVNASRDCVRDRLPGPLAGHCLREVPFQLLPLHALWRGQTHGYYRVELGSAELPDGWSVIPTFQTDADVSIRQVQQKLQQINRENCSHAEGREKVLQEIERLLPIARTEGAAQTLTLLALGEVIRFGGVSGRLLAPVSLLDYTTQALVPFYKVLFELGLAAEGEEYCKEYEDILQGVKKSQVSKAASLLQALHDRLVLRGAVMLPRALSGKGLPLTTPYSNVVWPHELALAFEYIEQAGGDQRVQAQARLLIRLGSAIPFRTSEFFQLRLVDVCPGGSAYLVNYPRGRDGTHKASKTRMQHDLLDEGLIRELLDHKIQRAQQEALPDGVLDADPHFFGKPGFERSYKSDETTELVNAALRWATGDPRTSVYDLRHSVISQRAVEALQQDSDQDVDPWQKMSRGCGHGDPDSTRSYVHGVERALHGWLHPEDSGQADEANPCDLQLPTLESLFQNSARPEIRTVVTPVRCEARDLTIDQMNALLAGVALRYPPDYLNARFDLEDGCLDRVLSQLRWCWTGLPPTVPVDATAREICHFMTSQKPASVHALQPKYTQIKRRIESLARAGEWQLLRAVHTAWRVCVKGQDVDLSCGSMSAELVGFLKTSGIYKRQLLALCDEGESVLHRQLAEQVGLVTSQKPRKGRPKARLFIVDADVVNVAHASGATLSITGLNWLMNVLGVLLVVRGEK